MKEIKNINHLLINENLLNCHDYKQKVTALSTLKNKLGMDTEPRILGTINSETEFVLKKFKIPVPLYLNDVKVQIKDVKFNKNYVCNENKPIIDAFSFMNENSITGLPLVDDNKKFKGDKKWQTSKVETTICKT